MLLGPVDFEAENESVTLTTSSGVHWDRSIESKLWFRGNLEKWLYEGGISDLIVSVMDVKKSLKELATGDSVTNIDRYVWGRFTWFSKNQIKNTRSNFMHVIRMPFEVPRIII